MTDLNQLHEVLQRREAVAAEVDPSVLDVMIRAHRWRRTQRIGRAVLFVAAVVALGAVVVAVGLMLTS